MEEDATGEALQKACHIVRQVIGRNVENFINKRIRSIDERITQTTYNIGKRNRQKEKKKESPHQHLLHFKKEERISPHDLIHFKK